MAIKNAFNKTKLVTLKGGAHEKVDMMADLLCSFKALNIPIDESTRNEFVHVDDENSEEFSREILDDVNKVLESIQATNDNEDENVHTVVETCAHSPASTENDVTFCGFKPGFSKLSVFSCFFFLESYFIQKTNSSINDKEGVYYLKI